MGYLEIAAQFEPLFEDAKREPQYWDLKPLLAHYTSLTTLECIVRNREVWFSNPLMMNDYEELRFGIINSVNSVRDSKEISIALETDDRRRKFTSYIDHLLNELDEKHLLDIYVFCLSEFDPKKPDGLLSMWRGYGADGNGAAVVFDTSKLGTPAIAPIFFLAPVKYADHAARLKWIENLVTKFAEIAAQTRVHDDDLFYAASRLFERIRFFALFTKHSGFSEEQEWRAVYLPDIDREQKLRPYFGYHVTARGVEPKLKFPIRPIDGLTEAEATLENLVHSIVLGPTSSMPMARRSVERMLELAGAPTLNARIKTSAIPYRPMNR